MRLSSIPISRSFVLRPEPREMLELAIARLRDDGVDARVFPDTDSAAIWLRSE
jgi:hypothetical protein